MTPGIITVSYLGASALFILALGGLSHQETARRGNWYGIVGMALALVVTIFGIVTANYALLIGALVVGGALGYYLAQKVEMTQMPELVAILHSLVGLAAVLVGFANAVGHGGGSGIEKTIHDVETYIGILIGALTFSGSVVAYLKLSAKIGGKPIKFPGRHLFNLGLLVAAIWLGAAYVDASAQGGGMLPLVLMTVIALMFGVHMVVAIGGADMPVVVSLLNSYSGWTASAAGFMLQNDLLIVTGALVGSSGAILSVIMCRAMNRSIWNVVFSGFGSAPRVVSGWYGSSL